MAAYSSEWSQMKEVGKMCEINNSHLLNIVSTDNSSIDPILYTPNHDYPEYICSKQWEFVFCKV
jgi:hypothetical protein